MTLIVSGSYTMILSQYDHQGLVSLKESRIISINNSRDSQDSYDKHLITNTLIISTSRFRLLCEQSDGQRQTD